MFDPAGNLVKSWGGPGQGYEWPQSNHGIHVDYKGNVWIGGNGEKDAQILKFTKDGKFLLQVGHFGGNAGSNNLENFGRAAKIWVDPKTNEAYVADGYKNKRVAVLDADTGVMKRYWGAYGTLGLMPTSDCTREIFASSRAISRLLRRISAAPVACVGSTSG